MSDSDAINKLINGVDAMDKLLGRVERIGAAARWLLGLLVMAVLWVARVEWNHQNHEGRLASVEHDAKGLTRDVDRMKGSLGMTASPSPHGKAQPPASYVWKPEDECQEEAQATH